MKRKRICIICGKEIKNKKDVICEECEVKKEDIRVINEGKDTITICECLRYKKGKSWLDPPLRYYLDYSDYLISIIKKHYEGYEIIDINNKQAILKKEGKLKRLDFNKGTCDVCSRVHGGYYEGKIQIRGSDKFVEKMEREISEIIDKDKHVLSFISRVNYLKEGVDIYIGNKKLINKIKKKYKNHETKVSKELYSVKDSRRIYRITLLIREKR